MPYQRPHLLFLLAVLIAALCSAQTSDAPPRPGIADVKLKKPITALQPTAVIQTDEGSDWVTIDSAVWVSSKSKNTLTRIDPKTNTVAASIALDQPCSGLASGFGSVWVPLCGEQVLARVDETTNKVIAKIPTTIADSEGSITTSTDTVWLVTGTKDTLVRINPRAGKIVNSVKVAAGSVAVRYGIGALWVTSPEKNVVTRVDPVTKTVVATVPVGKRPRFLAVGDRDVWVINQGDGTVSRIDPNTNSVSATIDCGITGDGGDIAVGGGFVWVSAPTIPVTRISISNNAVTQQFVGDGGDSIGFGLGSVWLANGRAGNVWRFQP
jgi:virginiamycin B lyase